MTLSVTAVQRASTNSSGQEGNGDSFGGVLSPDGTKVAFNSDSNNLVAGDTNGTNDIFVKDLATGAITRVNTSGSGAQANGVADRPYWSPDGTKILFASYASNLVAGDTNPDFDIFIKDLTTGAVTPVSTTAAGAFVNGYNFHPAWSPDGTQVVFSSYANDLSPDDYYGTADVYIKDLSTGAIELVSKSPDGVAGDDHSQDGVFAPDGTYVAFTSLADNLRPADGNFQSDVYVKKLTGGAVALASTAADGVTVGDNASYDPSIAPGGGPRVLFTSDADNLVPGDVNGVSDIFIKNLATGEVTLVSQSMDGRQANHASRSAVFSPDGTYVAFISASNNLVAGVKNFSSHVYVKDLITGAVSDVSGNIYGAPGNGDVDTVAWSADGTKVIYGSQAANLLNTGDSNAKQDVFVATLHEDDIIKGTANDDTIQGRDSSEKIFGTAGNDTVHAGGGKDQVDGGSGDDFIWGENGNDTLIGSSGNDQLDGGEGDDILQGGGGNDFLGGGFGDDTLAGGAGDDLLSGASGNDVLQGASGHDTLEGGNGNDILHGGENNDILYGGASSDRLYGDDGDDALDGGTGTNWLTGGAGADSFVVEAWTFDGTADKVTDFKAAEGDILRLHGVLQGFEVGTSSITDFVTGSQVGGDTMFSIDRDGAGSAYTAQNVFILKGVTSFDVQALYTSNNITVT